MMCEHCGRDGAQPRSIEGSGEPKEVFLCDDCYKKLYGEQSEGEFFAAFSKGGADKACPDCGTTLADFRATGLLGCARCYATFRKELVPAVRSAQGLVYHVGRVPNGVSEESYDETLLLVNEKHELESDLSAARAAGDAAAVLRIEAHLRAINRRLNGGEA